MYRKSFLRIRFTTIGARVRGMESARKAAATPLLLITGFLGSGKTTFINRLLALPRSFTTEQPRLGVVVNEFGQIGIDGALLAQAAGDDTGIMELANGCVCCIRGTEMWESALELVDRAGAEVLLVETSGLVEPRILLEQYRLLPEKTKSRIDLRGLLCVVDVLHVRESIGQRTEAVQQLELADRLLLSKLDAADAAQVADAHQLLDELRATSERASISFGSAEAEVSNVLRWALSAPRGEKTARSGPEHNDGPEHRDEHGHQHGGRQLVAVSLHEAQPLLAAPLLQLLRELSGQVLRAKGIVRVLGAPWQKNEPGGPPMESVAALHLAGRRVELQPLLASPVEVPAGSTLVFIAESIDENWLRLRISGCRSPVFKTVPSVQLKPAA
jgi:G3E family GTPase